MGNVINAARGIAEKLRSRGSAVAMLALACAMLAIAIAANLTSVSIKDGDTVTTVITMRRDTKTILNKASIAVSVNDRVLETPVNDNEKTILIMRAFTVSITDGKNTAEYETVGGTVGDVLGEAGIEFPDEDDIVTPSVNSEVTEGVSIVINRVEYQEKTTTEAVKYSTEKVNDKTLAKGKTKVTVKGVNGEKEIVTRYKYVDGELVSSEVISSVITKQPVTEKIAVGTKKVTISTRNSYNNKVTVNSESGTVTVNGETISYKKVLSGTGTAYTASAGAVCSTGCKAAVGKVAVNPKVIPYGTKLFITSADGKYVYGYAVAADTGGALMSGRVLCDLYMNTESECYRFGRRKINVYVL